MTALSDAETTYLADLKAAVDAADAHDAPINAQIATHNQAIATLQKSLAQASDPTIRSTRQKYQFLTQATRQRPTQLAGSPHMPPARPAAGATGAAG